MRHEQIGREPTDIASRLVAFKGKGFKQIGGVADGFVVADDIEVGFKNKLPLWVFGFMY